MRVGEIRHPERAQFGAPLAGVRILAVEQMQALPYATQLMAHLGADVVKVEHPKRGESGRDAQPAVVDAEGRSVGATYLRTVNIVGRLNNSTMAVPSCRVAICGNPAHLPPGLEKLAY